MGRQLFGAFSLMFFFFLSMWSFLWSSIRLRLLLVCICLFRMPVCYGWRWIFFTRIHVRHLALMFSNFIFFSVVGISSCHLPLLVGRIFFLCFRMSGSDCIVLPFLDVFLIFLLSSLLSGLFFRVILSFFSYCFFFIVSKCSTVFSLFYHFYLLMQVSYLRFQ